MEAAALVRTRSGPLPSPMASLDHEVVPRSLQRRGSMSPIVARPFHLEMSVPTLRRAWSEASLSIPAVFAAWKSPAKTSEEDEEEEIMPAVESSPILSLGVAPLTAVSRRSEVLVEELEFSEGGGSGGGRKIGRRGRRGGSGGGGGDPRNGMGAYYKEMLKVDPENPLLLMNYGRFLQEVEGDLAGAEEFYGRAILANPSDGEALSRYGNLMWEAHRDEERAEGFFQRAVEASPEDCYVLGSYAHFLWDADEENERSSNTNAADAASSSKAFMVEAF